MGKPTSAYDAFEKSVASLKRSNHIHFQIVGMVHLAEIHMTQGQLHNVMTIYLESLQISSSTAEKHSYPLSPKDTFIPGTVDLYVGLSELHYRRGELETAQQLADTDFALSRQTICSTSRDKLAIVMVRIQIGLGHFGRALILLQEAEQYSQSTSTFIRYPIPAVRAYLWLLEGKLDNALNWAKNTGLSHDDDLSFHYEFNYLTLARVLIALYHEQYTETAVDEAQHMLNGLLNLAQNEGRTDSVIEILILQSIVYMMQSDNQTALDILGDALKLAEPENYIQVFVDEGDPM